MWTQDQQQKTFTSSPSLLRVIFWGIFGLPFVGGGLVMTAAVFTKGIGAIFGGAMFLGGGVYLERKAYNALRRWRAFGTSHLRLETAPVPLGTTLRARLRVPVSAQDQPPNGFQARVICTQGHADDKEQVWQNSTSVRGQPGVEETVVSFALDLPARPLVGSRRRLAEATPWSSEKNATEKLDWTLKVTASFEDKPDYEASFDLPVVVPDDFDKQTGDDQSTDKSDSPRMSGDSGDAGSPSDPSDVDEVRWDASEDGQESHSRRAASEEELSDGAEEAFSEPVSEGIRMDGGPGKGLTFSFEHARQPARPLGYLKAGLGTLFTGLGAPALYAAFSDDGLNLLLFGLGSLLVLGGGVALREAWAMFTHASTIRIAEGQIEVRKGPFFLDSEPTRILCEALENVEVENTGGIGSQSFYALSLVEEGSRATDEASILVVDGLTDKEEAQWIASCIEAASDQVQASAQRQASTQR